MTKSSPPPDSEILPATPSAMPKTKSAPPTIQPLTTKDVAHLLQADLDLWPQPLTQQHIEEWHALSEDWSWKYTINDESAGLFYCIPLKEDAFDLLKRGSLEEHCIRAEHIWKDGEACNSAGASVGVHIFHVEREHTWRRDWGRMMHRVFLDLQQLLDYKKLNVLGYSALAVTAAGYNVFQGLGFDLIRVEKLVAGMERGGSQDKSEPSALIQLEGPIDTKAFIDVGFQNTNGYWFFKEGRLTIRDS